MASIYDKASLVLIPSGTKTSKVYSQKPTNGDGDFTFSRSTAATRVNASGNIEKETGNLLLQSNSFDTTWANSGTAETGGQSGYDGSNDAWLITKSASDGYIYQNISQSGVQCVSVYAKANALGGIQIYVNAGTTRYQSFNLTNGTLIGSGNGIDAKIESVGNGWYRCSMSFNDTITRVRFYPMTDAGDKTTTSGSIYIQDAQLEQGLVARDYIETTTAAVEGGITDNVPRLDYTDSSCPALLLEPQRTNIFTQSEFAALALVSNVNKTNNYGQSPEGVNNSTRLQFTANGFVGNNTQTNGTQYTLSCYAKRNDSGTQDVGFFQDGTGYVNSSWSLTSEWQRFTYTYTAANSSYAGIAGISGADVSVYGFQMEAGSYATSYIPTYGSAVTRNQDDCENTNLDLLSQDAATYFLESTPIAIASNNILEVRGNGNTNDRLLMQTNSSGILRILVRNSGSTILDSNISSAVSAGTKIKVALKYTSTNISVFVDGVKKIDSDLSVNFGSPLDWINLEGTATANNDALEQHQFLFFSTALTDQEAIDLTTL